MFDSVPPINQSPAFLMRFFMELGLTIVIIGGILLSCYVVARYWRKMTPWATIVVGIGLGWLFDGVMGGVFFGLVGFFINYHLSQKRRA